MGQSPQSVRNAYPYPRASELLRATATHDESIVTPLRTRDRQAKRGSAHYGQDP